MPVFSFLQQQMPDDCPSGPVTIGNYQLSLFDIEEFGTGFRWIYRIDSAMDSQDLSNWVLAIGGDCFPVGQCFISDLFTGEVTEEILDSLAPYDNCLPGPEPAPRVCPEDSNCSAGETVVGFKFDSLPDGLSEGNSQLFAFIINQPPIFETGCAALTSAGETFCGEICVPSCLDCPDACECGEDTFNCVFDFPETCFTLPADVTVDDVLSGFCIGTVSDVETDICQGVAEIFVCGETLFCCADVQRFSRTVDLQVQLNIPKEGDCGGPVYECCFDEVTVTQNCFTCIGDPAPEFPEVTCDNVSIVINSITEDPETGDVTVNYTVDLPDCVVVDDTPTTPAPPTTPNCPPPAPATRNIQPVNKTAINMPTVNSAKRRRK